MIIEFQKQDAMTCSRLIVECVSNTPEFNDHEAKLIIETDTPQQLVEKSNRFSIFIYKKEKQILGICGLDGETIRGCFIKLTEQNKGIGKKLVNYVEKIAKKKGIEKLKLSSAKNAEGFWIKMGYSSVGVITKKYKKNEFINISMEKIIKIT